MKETFKSRVRQKGLSEHEFNLLKKIKGKMIYCIIRSTSQSGMTRKLDFYVIIGNDLVYITHIIAAVTDSKRDNNRSLIVTGCGMDMIFSVLHNFNYDMSWFVTGKDRATLLETGECGERIFDRYYINANNYTLL